MPIIEYLGLFIFNSISGGIIYDFACSATAPITAPITQKIANQFDHTEIINHDIQKALNRSFLSALITICDGCLSELKRERVLYRGKSELASIYRWLDEKKGILENNFRLIEKAEYKEITIEELDNIKILLIKGTTESEAFQKFKSKLMEEAGAVENAPKCYRESVENNILNLMGDYFANEIKTNQAVHNIFDVQYLIKTDIKTDALLDYFYKYSAKFDIISNKIDDIHDVIMPIPHVLDDNFAKMQVQMDNLSLKIKELYKNEPTFYSQFDLLTDELLSHRATPERLKQFYMGANLDWDIIAANGDISRDQQEELIKKATEPVEGMRFICIVAEPGGGKSTLAWRVANELYKHHRAFVIHIKDSGNADIWYRLPEFCQKIGVRLFVLVDDIFRDPDAQNACLELKPWLPITVIATSRRNEYNFHGQRLKTQPLVVDLKNLSPNEKERILIKSGKDYSALTPEQRHRFDTTNQFLVLMIELTGGKELCKIIQETIELLRCSDESAYRAYEYLCFTYQYSITFPLPLLERLDEQGSFYNLPDRDSTQGLIFWDTRKGCIRVGHPIIAEHAASFYATSHTPQVIINKIVNCVDATAFNERHFLVLLMYALSKSQVSIQILCSLQDKIDNFVQNVEGIYELLMWERYYLSIGQYENVKKCRDFALTIKPIAAADCQALLRLYSERRKEKDAFPIIIEWLESHAEDNHVRAAYLGLVERNGTPEQIAQAIKETTTWLESHAHDNNVRAPYLGLVERNGTPEQIAQAIEETTTWLESHAEDNHVRTTYLGLVKRNGTPEQIAQAIKETTTWLESHASTDIISMYLSFVQHDIDEQTVIGLYEKLIKTNPKNINYQIHYTAWLRDKGKYEEAEQRYQELIPRVQSTKHNKVRLNYGYGLLLLHLERFDEAGDKFREVLRITKRHEMAHFWLAHTLWKLNDLTQAEQEFKEAIYYAASKGKNTAKFYNHLGWFYFEQRRYREAKASFEVASDENPEYFGNYWGIGKILFELGEYKSAESVLNIAIDKAPLPLEPPASEDIPELIRKCKEHY